MGLTFVKAATDALLPVSRDQAVRLFQELRVEKAEIVDDVSAWTFVGGVVLIQTIEPAGFSLALDTADA